eukprot:s3945_g3.t1
MANYTKAAYAGKRLLGLFRRECSSGGPRDLSFPMVRRMQDSMTEQTPVLYDYSSSSAGRRQGRIRHVHRPSRSVRDLFSMKLQTLNCQGLCWHNLKHRDKLVQLLLHMRSSKADLVALTELHGTTGPQIIHVEEFVLIVNDRAGWLMTLELYVRWCENGSRRWHKGDNLCALSFDVQDKCYVFVAVYMLPYTKVAERRQSLVDLDSLRAEFPAGCHEVLAGDWNAHAGMDHVGDHVHQGQFSMSTGTTMGGRIHRTWLYGTDLCMVDSFRPCSKRATWRHRNGNFYELDFFCASQSIRKEFQSVTTFSCAITDHWGKQVIIHFSDFSKSKARVDRKLRFQHFARVQQLQQNMKRLNLSEMRGPAEEAGRKRCLFRSQVEDQLAHHGIQSSLPAEDLDSLPHSDFFAHLFTDGSCGEDGNLVSGWGLCVALADGIEKYCAPVTLTPSDPLFHGAAQHSNNVAEIEAIGAALKWILSMVPSNSVVTLGYDSQYAANMVRGHWSPQANLALIQWAQWQLKRVISKGIRIEWRWIRGHQGVHGNEMADFLAKEGARGVSRIFPAFQVPDQMSPPSILGAVPPRRRHRSKSGGPRPRPSWDGTGLPWFMQGEFANTEPLLDWNVLSQILVDAAHSVVGRTASQLGVPYLESDLAEIQHMRDDMQLLWSRLQTCEDRAQQVQLKQQHRTLSRQLQRFRSKARFRFVRSLCAEADQHFRFHDLGRFYKTLKKIGVHLTDQSFAGQIDHNLEDLRRHCQAVSGEVQSISDDVLQHVPWGTVATWLGDTPSAADVRQAVRQLRDCAPGRDEITAGMLKWAGP